MESLVDILDETAGIVLKIPGVTNAILAAMPEYFTTDEIHATKHDLAYDYLWSLLLPVHDKHVKEAE